MRRRKPRPAAVKFHVGSLLALWDPDTDDTTIAEALGVTRGTVNRWRMNRNGGLLNPWMADRLAIRAGSHPGIVWGDAWWEAALQAV